MNKSWLITLAVAAMIMMVVSKVKETHPPQAASGCAGVSLFIFLWFIMFVLPRFKKWDDTKDLYPLEGKK